MTRFGGMGGIKGGREHRPEDLFEVAVKRALGDQMATDHDLCVEVWSALTNRDWRHVNGDTADYSFRAAGDVVAAVRGEGDYMDWYCSGPKGAVSTRVRAALLREGWQTDEP